MSPVSLVSHTIIVKFEYSPTDHICDNNGQNIMLYIILFDVVYLDQLLGAVHNTLYI